MSDMILQFIDKHTIMSILILGILCLILCWVLVIADTVLHLLFGGLGVLNKIMICISKDDISSHDSDEDVYAELLLFGFVIVMYPGLIVSAAMYDKLRKEDVISESNKVN